MAKMEAKKFVTDLRLVFSVLFSIYMFHFVVIIWTYIPTNSICVHHSVNLTDLHLPENENLNVRNRCYRLQQPLRDRCTASFFTTSASKNGSLFVDIAILVTFLDKQHSLVQQCDQFICSAVLTFPEMNVRCLRLSESRPVHTFTGRINPALRHITGILLWSRTGRPFRPRRCRSLSSAVVAFLLLLSGDIESSPGPPSCKVQFKQYSFASTTRGSVFMTALLLLAGIEPNSGPAPYKQKSSIRVGTLNAWSAVYKGPLICDIIEEHVLDVLVITESWFNSDMPPAITDSIAPGGFGVEHFFRDGHAGGGVSIVYSLNLKVRKLRLEVTLSSLELLGIKIVSRTGVTNIVGIYRPGSRAASSSFFTELGSLFSEINMLPGNTIYIGDFNCPGKSSCEIDEHLSDIIDLYNLKCCEGSATRLSDGVRGNRLDLIVHNLGHGDVTNPCTIDVGFIDHCLVRADFRFAAFESTTASLRWRNLKRIDFEELDEELWNCSFVTDPADTVDGFIDQLHHDVTCVLDRMAPIHETKVRTG